MSVVLVIRDSVSGNMLYKIIKLNGEVLIFDYVVTSRRKVDALELFDWLREHEISLEVDSELRL